MYNTYNNIIIIYFILDLNKTDRCTYNVILRRFRVTILAAEK